MHFQFEVHTASRFVRVLANAATDTSDTYGSESPIWNCLRNLGRPIMDRRTFLQGAAAAGFSVATASAAVRGANDRVAVCVMGLRGRGGSLLSTFASLPDVDVTYVCDVDSGVLR